MVKIVFMTTTILQHNRVTWTNITQPTAVDIQTLGEKYPHFHPLNLQDCLTELEFPKIDQHADHLFLVTQFPRWDHNERISQICEVDIFVGRGTLVTSSLGNLKPLLALFERAQTDATYRETAMGQGASPLLYLIFDTLVNYCYPIMHKVNQNIRHIEQNLFDEDTQHILREVSIIRRDVIALRHILRPQIEVVQTLERGNWEFIHEDLDLYWGDISDHLLQIRAMLDEHMEVIGGLSDTIDTLASHRVDEVVRLLTIITILTVPFTVLPTIFGMNVRLPFETHPLPFFIINLVSILLTVFLIWYLRHRRWM